MNELQPSVLIVDDLEENLLALESILEDEPIVLVRAQSGEEALLKVLEREFALIILDVMMPTMDGFETAELIHSRKKCQHVPIIFLTGLGTDDMYVYKGYETGAVDYLTKPVDPEVLKSKVKVFVELYRQKNKIEVLNRQITEFAGIVSHDLRNPLGNIGVIANMLLNFTCNTCELEKPRELMRRLSSESDKALALVHDILDLTAIETGRIQIEMQPIDIIGVVKEALAQNEFKASDKAVALILTPESFSCQVWGDGKRLLQILDNLLSNAIKFTPRQGQVTVNVVASDNQVTVQVIDNGVGISEKALPKLFDKHQITSTPGTDGEAGTGFGLPLSQELVRAHGSSIEVQSIKDQGATFSFVLRQVGACP